MVELGRRGEAAPVHLVPVAPEHHHGGAVILTRHQGAEGVLDNHMVNSFLRVLNHILTAGLLPWQGPVLAGGCPTLRAPLR